MSLLPSVTLHLNPWRNYESFQHHTLAQRHEYMIGRLENARRREWVWVVIVAGIGFFTDAYAIFSVNMVTPMLGIVYYGHPDKMPHEYEVALSIATLGGALVGQVLFGVAADIWGRRKMYGLELAVLIFTTVGLALASSGAEGSMSVIGLLIFWRFFMGLGLGGDYPLSAVICSEFAPTRIRGRMLASVFLCQSLGALAANLVALIAVAGFRDQLLAHETGADGFKCFDRCVRDVDSIWRLIVGLGAVPAFIALWFRLTIIESPRYTAEVTQNSLQAAADVTSFFRSDGTVPVPALAPEIRQTTHDANLSPTTSRPDSHPSSITSSRSSVPEQVAGPVDCVAFLKEFKAFAVRPRTFKLLFATCFCWFCLDIPFYGLGLSTPSVITTIWDGSDAPQPDMYNYLLRISYRSMVVVSSGAVVGNLLAIATIDRLGRRNIQLSGFFWLTILNIVIGATFRPLADKKDSSALIVLYILSQIFFNFGPNTTTYIIPAEIFPTRFRCTCHGLAAASGKLGSVIAQCFLAFVDYGKGSKSKQDDPEDWLGYSLLCLSAFMLLGLIITYLYVPDVKDEDGKIKSLERLAEDLFVDERPEGREVEGRSQFPNGNA
ncbi:major facilitator superfamily domain-containing protein [Aspergillus undulatus]|uniref:major facilitator superfamily domain-containing protein n=1 Tax=Aspergillus undulatus TaxID=1810928 RepID=UPI003CCCB6BB